MKKLLFLLFFIPFTIFAQQDTTIVVTNVERIVDKYSTQVIGKFESVLAASTPMAKEGFEMITKLEFVKGLCGFIHIVLCLFFGLMCWKEYFRLTELSKDTIYGPLDEEIVTPILYISFILFILCFLVGIFEVSGSIQRIIVPEWFAIKELFNLVK